MKNGMKAMSKRSGPKGGTPKDCSDGKDLSKNAKNVIPGTKLTQRPISPSANRVAVKEA